MYENKCTIILCPILLSMGDATNGSQKCIPFVSVYSDCNEENLCSGCSQCNCTAAGTWECNLVQDCKRNDAENGADEENIEVALQEAGDEIWLNEIAEAGKSSTPFVPQPQANPYHLDEYVPPNLSHEFFTMMRHKRSVVENGDDHGDGKENETITFHNIVDEVNEDTLKNSNSSGTLPANKMDAKPQASRRTTLLTNSTSNSLHIEHTPSIFNPHAADNKIDTSALHDDKEDLLIHHKIFELVGNQSLSMKDKDLSKLLVNEMKIGSETIGNKNETPVSNITFTPDNDTLTAVTFIAGNLLNKLWNMEKDINDDSMDTELMKHRTINNLLDLFKEPLNLRQETFLKHALEQLSTAMENTDISNISLCENIEKLKKESLRKEGTGIDRSNSFIEDKEIFNQSARAADALSKINNALDLITKYERVQNSISDLKSNSEPRKTDSGIIPTLEHLTKNEESTLNMFGNILGSVTKLLMPNKKSKKVLKGLQSKHSFSDKNDLNERLKKLNLGDLTISDKDKIVLDYLTHIQNSPKCLLNRHRENPNIPAIEGNILLNLSEFFKIKSMSDLLKLVETTKPPKLRSELKETTTIKFKTDLTTETTTSFDLTTSNNMVTQFKDTKDKLKSHLKTILDDLIELQNINGKSSKGKNVEIADALPCIYNLLNANNIYPSNSSQTKIQTKKQKISPSKKVAELFQTIKKELKSQTRRTNVGSSSSPRPKSAIVWERTIKNLRKNSKTKTRRSIDVDIPKTLEELKKMMDKIESSGSNTYKSVAFLAEVPAAERLLLLKTLIVDTYKYIGALQDLKQFLNTFATLPNYQYKPIDEFIDNVNINVNLNEKVIKNLDKPKKGALLSNKQVRFKKVESLRPSEEVSKAQWKDNSPKLSRDQILNQLIKNRILFYIRMKESSLDGTANDMNYDLAKKILFYLEIGNYNLARDLFKMFMSRIKQEPIVTFGTQALDPATYKSLTQQKIVERRLSQDVVPLIQFEDPKAVNEEMPWSNQDQLIKQLLTIKNMQA